MSTAIRNHIFLLREGISIGRSGSKSYYVSNSGNDNNNGLSSSTPWQTIDKVNNSVFIPHSKILFKKGDTWREALAVPSSSIEFGSYGNGDDPIITGFDVVTGFTSEASTQDIGETTTGASADTEYGGYVYTSPITVAVDGTVESISRYVTTAVSAKAKCAIYTDSGGVPSSLVANSVTSELTLTPNSTNVFTYSGTKPVLTAGNYWVAIISDTNHGIRYTGGSGHYSYMSRVYASGFPSSYTVEGDSANTNKGFYLTLTPSVGSLYYKDGYSSNPYTVARNGVLQVNVELKTDLDSAGQWWYDSVNDRVYLYGDPSSDVIEISSRLCAVNPNGKNNVTFRNLMLYGGTVATIYVNNHEDNLTIDNCHTKNSYDGLTATVNSGNNGTVMTSHFEYAYNKCVTLNSPTSAGWRIISNEANNAGIESAQLLGGTYPSGMFIKMANPLIEHNNIHDNGRSGFSNEHGIYVEGGTGSIVRYNKFNGNAYVGLKIWAATNILVHHNLCYNNAIGMSYEYGSTGGRILNNTIAHNTSGATDDGKGLKIATASVVAELLNNIFYENINTVNLGNKQITSEADCDITLSDNNLIYFSGGGNIAIHKTVAKTFAQWQALGFDEHGVNDNPDLVSSSDLHLQVGSPAINAGTDVGLTEDYDGNPIDGVPDIGAYEKQ